MYKKFNGAKAANHTRMRLGLSGLKAQRHDYNHVPYPNCEYCGARQEDPLHCLLKCRSFVPMRLVLLRKVQRLYDSKNITRDLSRTIVQKELVECLLKGDTRLSELGNVDLFRIVQEFIAASKRF